MLTAIKSAIYVRLWFVGRWLERGCWDWHVRHNAITRLMEAADKRRKREGA